MRTLVSTMLMTAWMFSVVLGFTLGGAIHALAIGAVMVTFLSGERHPRAASR